MLPLPKVEATIVTSTIGLHSDLFRCCVHNNISGKAELVGCGTQGVFFDRLVAMYCISLA